MTNILEISNVHKSFTSSYTGLRGNTEIEPAEIRRAVSLNLQAGTVTALIGSNGRGKSTLFNVISGLLKADKGKIMYYYEGSHII